MGVQQQLAKETKLIAALKQHYEHYHADDLAALKELYEYMPRTVFGRPS